MDGAPSRRQGRPAVVGKCPKCFKRGRVCDGLHHLCEKYAGGSDRSPEIATILHGQSEVPIAVPRPTRSACATGSGSGSGMDNFFMVGSYGEGHAMNSDTCTKTRTTKARSEAKCEAKARAAARTIASFNLGPNMQRGNSLLCLIENLRPRYIERTLHSVTSIFITLTNLSQFADPALKPFRQHATGSQRDVRHPQIAADSDKVPLSPLLCALHSRATVGDCQCESFDLITILSQFADPALKPFRQHATGSQRDVRHPQIAADSDKVPLSPLLCALHSRADLIYEGMDIEILTDRLNEKKETGEFWYDGKIEEILSGVVVDWICKDTDPKAGLLERLDLDSITWNPLHKKEKEQRGRMLLRQSNVGCLS
jgi:hypothetical protein